MDHRKSSKYSGTGRSRPNNYTAPTIFGSQTMNEAEFNQIVDELMFSIEESIDHSGADLDYENSAGMLTITCEANGSQIILSRQPAMEEIWLAARSGGFHFRLQAEDGTGTGDVAWRNTVTAELLSTILAEACTVQSGERVSFDF